MNRVPIDAYECYCCGSDELVLSTEADQPEGDYFRCYDDDSVVCQSCDFRHHFSCDVNGTEFTWDETSEHNLEVWEREWGPESP